MNTVRILPVIVLLGLLGLAGDCQASAPTEFLGIEWGATPAEAKSTMATHEGVSIKEESVGRIVFQGGTFATHPAERWVLEFPGGKFSRGTVYITVPPGKEPNGTLLRNQQFEDYYKTLSYKYRRGRRGGGDQNHAQALWLWAASNPRSGAKEQQCRSCFPIPGIHTSSRCNMRACPGLRARTPGLESRSTKMISEQERRWRNRP